MFCSQCGIEVGENQTYCHACGRKIEEPAQAETRQEKTTWEMRLDKGFFPGLVQTLKESLFNPTAFFRKMPLSGGLTDPALYAMITGMAGMTMLFLWQMLFRESMPVAVPGDLGESSGGPPGLAAIFAPFLVLANLYVWAGMLHVILLVVRGARHGFEATFRTAAYSYGPLVFLAVPVCGWPTAAVWSMVMAVIGLREAQGASGSKAAFAVLFPVIFCCAIAALFSMLLFGSIAASFSSMLHHPGK